MDSFIRRNILERLQAHLEKPEITLIAGPRQAGKTTLMKKLEEGVRASGKPTLFLNLDVEGDRRFFESQELLLRRILRAIESCISKTSFMSPFVLSLSKHEQPLADGSSFRPSTGSGRTVGFILQDSIL